MNDKIETFMMIGIPSVTTIIVAWLTAPALKTTFGFYWIIFMVVEILIVLYLSYIFAGTLVLHIKIFPLYYWMKRDCLYIRGYDVIYHLPPSFKTDVDPLYALFFWYHMNHYVPRRDYEVLIKWYHKWQRGDRTALKRWGSYYKLKRPYVFDAVDKWFGLKITEKEMRIIR